MSQKIDQKRRSLLAAAAVLPATALVVGRVAYAAEVDPASPQAVALKYTAASEVEGQDCSNCSLYQGAANGPTGKCPLFVGAEVNLHGWCSAWVAKG